MNNYLVLFIFIILAVGPSFFFHRYLMSNWEYYRHLQKNPSPIDYFIVYIMWNAWAFLIVLVLVFFFGDEWLSIHRSIG
tara:strand:- start:74 stop:310 length:237 start_codon:yes stop_codon:yes gene_type:complete